MKLIIGLGNPGEQYQKTRHNLGSMVLDKLAESETWQENKKTRALFIKKEINGQTVELLKPLTFMNESGWAAAYAFKKHRLKPEDVFIVYDDLDLPLGKIRIGKFNSAGGHNGVKSVIEHLKSKNFIRVRLGINPVRQNSKNFGSREKFVLHQFGPLEKPTVKQTIDLAAEAIQLALVTPLEKVMNKYN